MSQSRALRIIDIAAYLNVTKQRAVQMRAEGKFPKPERVEQRRPGCWKPATIERWAEREWWDTRRWRRRR